MFFSGLYLILKSIQKNECLIIRSINDSQKNKLYEVLAPLIASLMQIKKDNFNKICTLHKSLTSKDESNLKRSKLHSYQI